MIDGITSRLRALLLSLPVSQAMIDEFGFAFGTKQDVFIFQIHQF
ncbi:MAG TPA: hypothetical protein PLR22_08320 [Saprospiraceae bacterium]|nr:hypothetical protein [Saprospiraceae bacterium]